MMNVRSYSIQVFERAEGALIAGRVIPVAHAAEAYATAKALVPTSPGSAAIETVDDTLTDDRSNLTVLATFGDVPIDYQP